MKRKKLEKKIKELEKIIEAMKRANRALIDAVAERNEVQDGLNTLFLSTLMEEKGEINLPYFL